MIVLEELEHARARGAKIYAELLGYGVSSDATHVSDPDPTGESPARALADGVRRRRHLAGRGRLRQRARHVDARRRQRETRVIKLALGEEKAYGTPVSSTKGATGHCLGAAGAVEASFTILALERGMLPPTINQEVADPECDLDYIPNEARPRSRSRSASRTRSASAGTTPASSSAAGTAEPAVYGEAQLEQDRVVPGAVPLRDALAAADDAEAERLVEPEARVVLRDDRRLDRPDPVAGRVRDERSRAAPDRHRGRGRPRRRRPSARRRPGSSCAARRARPRPSRRPAARPRRRAAAPADARRPIPPTTAPASRTSRRRSRGPRIDPRDVGPVRGDERADATIDTTQRYVTCPWTCGFPHGASPMTRRTLPAWTSSARPPTASRRRSRCCARPTRPSSAPPTGPRSELREEWDGIDLERDAWLIELDGRLAGVAHLLERRGGRFVGDGYVHPELRGRGVGARF